MKRLLLLGAVALLTFPLVAEEKEQQKPVKKSVAAPADSPLVAAAKRSRRATTKTIVITDESVKNSTRLLTTSDSTYAPKLPETIEPSAEVVAIEQRAKARADQLKKEADEKAAELKRQQELARKARLAEGAENYEDGYDDGQDPAQVERDMAEAAKEKKPKPQF